MQHFFFQGAEFLYAGLDEQQVFAGVFDFFLPAVNRFDRYGEDVDARGQALFYDRASDLPRFGQIGSGDKNQPEIYGHGHCLYEQGLYRTIRWDGARGWEDGIECCPP